MERIHLFENWGVLGSEKTPVYSYYCPTTEAHNEVVVELPEGYTTVSDEGRVHIVKQGEELSYFNEVNNMVVTSRKGPALLIEQEDGHFKTALLRKLDE